MLFESDLKMSKETFMTPSLIQGDIFIDSRGTLSFINDYDFEGIKRFYMIQNHQQGFVRAWHGHKIESKVFYCVEGTFRIGLVPLPADDEKNTHLVEPQYFFLDSRKPQILIVPPGYANGTQNLSQSGTLMVFSNKSLSESKSDDYRFSHDYWGDWTIESS